MAQIQRLKDDLADHKLNIFWLQLYFLEKCSKLFLRDGPFTIFFPVEGFKDMLLVSGDKFCDLDEHFFLFVLVEKFKWSNIFFEMREKSLPLYLFIVTYFYSILFAVAFNVVDKLRYANFYVSVGQNWEGLGH